MPPKAPARAAAGSSSCSANINWLADLPPLTNPNQSKLNRTNPSLQTPRAPPRGSVHVPMEVENTTESKKSQRGKPIDGHVHVVGNGSGNSGCWLRVRGWHRPLARLMLWHIGL